MHSDRIKANKEYKAALAEWRKAEYNTQMTESEFIEVDNKLKAARKHLVEMEILHETPAEARKAIETVRFANRNPNY